MDRYVLLGLAVMVVTEAATLARVEPFWSWNTPIAWTGFIIFADAIVWNARGDSWMRSNAREFTLLALMSIPLWLVFEGYNRVIHNWHYVGLPENAALRLFGYAWSFATIWPAIFEGAELVAVRRAARSKTRRGRRRGEAADAARGVSDTRAGADVAQAFGPAMWSAMTAGAIMLSSPFLAPRASARYLAAPMWLGFIFLLDPVNARLGGESLLVDLRRRRYDRLINLAASGMLCGALWEFWNYWSRAKWHYSVPIMEHLKIFEMPLPGYLGFPAFALECFTMYVFVRAVCVRLKLDRTTVRRTPAGSTAISPADLSAVSPGVVSGLSRIGPRRLRTIAL